MCLLPFPPARTHVCVYLLVQVECKMCSGLKEVITTCGRPPFSVLLRVQILFRNFTEISLTHHHHHINFLLYMPIATSYEPRLGRAPRNSSKIMQRGTTSTFRYFTKIRPLHFFLRSLSLSLSPFHPFYAFRITREWISRRRLDELTGIEKRRISSEFRLPML